VTSLLHLPVQTVLLVRYLQSKVLPNVHNVLQAALLYQVLTRVRSVPVVVSVAVRGVVAVLPVQQVPSAQVQELHSVHLVIRAATLLLELLSVPLVR